MPEDSFRADRPPLVELRAIELHAADLTATLGADAPLARVQAALAQAGQWLALDGDPSLPVGELIEQNSTGPLRLGYGAWRDLLLGVQFINGRGELITAGGRTMKNVAGYDLTKFMVGSAGVFGRIVSATVRTYRKPAGALLARFAADGQIVGRLMSTSLRPQWAMLRPGALCCGYLGDQATIDYYRRALLSAEPLEIRAVTLEQEAQERSAWWGGAGDQMEWRASVPPSRIADFVTLAKVSDWVADAAFGVVVGPAATKAGLTALREAATLIGGAIRFHGGQATPEFSTNPAERRIIERLKLAFDPDGKLNLLPWLTR